MNFQDALTAMQAGHRVRRGKWTVVRYVRIMQEEFFGFVSEDRSGLEPMHIVYTFRSVDILAEDWELVERT